MFALLRICRNMNFYPLIQPPWSLFLLENVREAKQIHPFPEDGACNRHSQNTFWDKIKNKKPSCAPWRYLKALLKHSYPVFGDCAQVCLSTCHWLCFPEAHMLFDWLRMNKIYLNTPEKSYVPSPPPRLLLLFIIFSISVCWKHPLTLFPCSSLGWWFTASRW